MKRIFSVIVFLLTCVSSNANAWFFFFLPGSVTGKIADAFTGAEGENCVGPNSKVGDSIRLPNGSYATIKSLSGTSSRCARPEFPIRALLGPSENVASTFTSKAGIDLPDGWVPNSVTDQLKARGYFFYALNRNIDAGLLLGAAKREGITNMLEFADTSRKTQVAALKDSRPSEIESLQINDLPAWRYEVVGRIPTTGREIAYQTTVIDAGTEVITVRAWMIPALYSGRKEELGRLAFNITGFGSRAASPSSIADKASLSTPPVVTENASSSSDVLATKARIDVPENWEQRPLTDRLKSGRNVFYKVDQTTNSGLLLATVSRSGIADTATYATTRSAVVISLLEEPTQSQVRKLTINGAPAWQIEISGKTTARLPVVGAEGLPITILQTVYEGSQEIVILNSWTTVANYKVQESELRRIADSLTGIMPTNTVSPPSKPAVPDTTMGTEGARNPVQSDVASRLNTIKSLLDQGLITKDDYETKKQAILNSL